MTFYVEKAAIIGVGLLGASLGLDLKRRGLARNVIGIGRRMTSLQIALDKGAIDEASVDLADAATADLIVIAAPAALVIPTLDKLLPIIRPDSLVTDVASTKSAICRHAAGSWPKPRRFVGSHPMAGAETFGPAHGRENFYEGSVCLIEASDDLDPQAHDAIISLWQAVGARPLPVDAVTHDAILAKTSHLPHVLAAAMATVAGREGELKAFIGNGFRDFTRIAASNPEIWRDIVLTNRDALLSSLQDFEVELGAFREAIEKEDGPALESLFAAGRKARLEAVDL